MSWDLFVQDFPQSVESVEQIPDDFSPKPLGRRSEIIAKIESVLTDVDFSNPSWGILDAGADGYSIEFNMGDEETIDGFAMHVRGSSAAVESIAKVLSSVGQRAIDSSSGDFFDQNEAYKNLHSFNEYVLRLRSL